MPVRFITGRAGSGKSTLVLREIARKLEQAAEGPPLVLLVPEQATFRYERALAASLPSGGFMRAEVLSFRRLAFRVMQETGGSARIHIADTGKKMLLYKLLMRCKDELRTFRHMAGEPGFVDRLNDMLVELKRYRIDPDQLRDEAAMAEDRGGPAALPDKLHDLSLLYSAYEAAIADLYVDAEDDLAHLAAHFSHSSYAGKAEVWMDGFNGFTPMELEAVGAILQHAARVSIALCVDREVAAGEKPGELDLFHPTIRTCATLKEMALERGVAVEPDVHLSEAPRYATSPVLARLERALALGRSPEPELAWIGEPLTLVAADSRRAESEAAARRMIRLARDHGVRWRDMVVLVREPEQYRDVLATTLTDFGIPYFFDQKREGGHYPLPELIRAALETVTGGWRYESVFRAIKTGLLVRPDEEGEAAADQLRLDLDHLENYVLACGIQGSRWTDGKPWTWRPARSLEEADASPDGEQEAFLARINHVRDLVARPLAGLQKRLKQSANVREMGEAVWAFLEEVDAAGRMEREADACRLRGETERARELEGVWNQTVSLLDQLVEMMGDEKLKPDVFADLLDTGLTHLKLGLVPPALDQVLIGNLERSRPGAARHVFLLGASDGVLPRAIKEDGILSEREREKLAEAGLELAPGSLRRLLDESYMIYSALTLASETLWISWPQADEEGKAMLPAEVVRRIRRFFPRLSVETAGSEAPEPETLADFRRLYGHPVQVLSALTARLKKAGEGVPVSDLWRHVYNWFAADENRRNMLVSRTASLLHANEEENLSPGTSRQLFGMPLMASVSRMERFAACRFSHFAAYGLRLRERRMFRLAAPDIGQLYHGALSLIGRQLLAENRPWGSLSEAECQRLAEQAVAQLAPRLQGEILLSTGRYRYIAGKLTRIVGKAAAVLAEHGRRGVFAPAGLELGFGRGEPLPPLSFTLSDGTRMEVAGRIDRLDKAEGEQGTLLRIIDYKSSKHRLNMAEVYYGLSMQMLTYLDVAVTHARRWLGTDAKPGGVLYFHVHQPLIRAPHPLDPEDADRELLKRYKMTGLLTADPETVRLMDQTLEGGHSLIIPAGLKADGSFYKTSSVVSDGQWRLLRRHGRAKMRDIGEGILSGRVDIAPYRMGGQTACTHCVFKPVCHFDPLVEGNRYEAKTPYSAEEIWPLLEGGEGEDE